MDRGKRSNNIIANRNNKIYMDLKDIIREHTLPFLPAKSLFRFKTVCRDWKLQISTPFFAHNQSNCFHDVSGLFCQSRSNPPSFISLDPNSYGVPDPSLQFLPEPVDIKTSSNGLLCCQGHTGDKAYYICNPVTKQWKKLPKPNAYHGSDPSLVLMFEPSLLNFVAEYKLICAFPLVPQSSFLTQVSMWMELFIGFQRVVELLLLISPWSGHNAFMVIMAAWV
jgi:hypothetical protein